MKKIVLLLSLISFTFGFVSAENRKDSKESNSSSQVASMQGKIIDKTSGEPLTGVLVKIEGTKYEVYTDFDGNFILQNITPGVFDLKVSLVSYKENLLKDIHLSAGQSSILEIAIDN